MNIPSLPSDNLYKFLTAGGIGLIVLGVVLFVQQYEALRNRTFELQTKTALTEEKIKHWEGKHLFNRLHTENQYKRQAMIVARFLEFLKTADSIPQEKRDQYAEDVANLMKNGRVWAMNQSRAYMEEIYREAGKTLPQVEQQFFRDMEREYVELSAKLAEEMEMGAIADEERTIVTVMESQLEDLQACSKQVKCWCIVLWIIGSVFTIAGFVSWYFLFQRLQDQMLRLQLAEARSKKK